MPRCSEDGLGRCGRRLWTARGYSWQFDHVAELVYDALSQETLVSVPLVKRDWVRVGDLVLLSRRTAKSGGPAPPHTCCNSVALAGNPEGAEALEIIRSRFTDDGLARLGHASVGVPGLLAIPQAPWLAGRSISGRLPEAAGEGWQRGLGYVGCRTSGSL